MFQNGAVFGLQTAGRRAPAHLLAEAGGRCGLDDDDADVEEDGARAMRAMSAVRFDDATADLHDVMGDLVDDDRSDSYVLAAWVEDEAAHRHAWLKRLVAQ